MASDAGAAAEPGSTPEPDIAALRPRTRRPQRTPPADAVARPMARRDPDARRPG
ncbi:hypothetical protein [Streptomyces sp. SDr-06]|uniref:hypothetical protein n=1 Tax=Streptomyces sp. SDr-06 TaxID=2267702 RepID=UPI00167B7464|nr:hypothetical protein [Streptomyces sp. SDr-06]